MKKTIEMGYTPQEFARALFGNFTGETSPYRAQALDNSSWRVNHHDDSLSIDISIQAQAPRKLALLELPVLQVEFAIMTGDAQSQDDFFEKFFKYFHKGGG